MNRLPDTAAFAFKPAHFDDLMAQPRCCDWVEVHPENYMRANPRHMAQLEKVRQSHQLSLHGVGMSLASAQPVNALHLDRLAELVQRFEPAAVSEHLAWSHWNGQFFNDLLPIPYTRESLQAMASNVQRVQDRLQRTILIENPSLVLACEGDEFSEGEFLAHLVEQTGCQLLLDVNNLYVSASNLGRDPLQSLADYPLEQVAQIHLAGHSTEQLQDGSELRIDDHGSPVCDAVWALFARVLARVGRPLPTLVEWDTQTPPLDVLQLEMHQASKLLQQVTANEAAA